MLEQGSCRTPTNRQPLRYIIKSESSCQSPQQSCATGKGASKEIEVGVSEHHPLTRGPSLGESGLLCEVQVRKRGLRDASNEHHNVFVRTRMVCVRPFLLSRLPLSSTQEEPVILVDRNKPRKQRTVCLVGSVRPDESAWGTLALCNREIHRKSVTGPHDRHR